MTPESRHQPFAWRGIMMLAVAAGAMQAALAEPCELQIIDDGEPGSGFGQSVAMNGARAAIGEFPGGGDAPLDASFVHVYGWEGGQWLPQALLAPSGAKIYNAFGDSVAIQGDFMAVGDDYYSLAGRVYIFSFDGFKWVEEAILEAPVIGQLFVGRFGRSLDFEGDLLVVGASSACTDIDESELECDIDDHGAALVYRREGTGWSLEAVLVAPILTEESYVGDSVDVEQGVLLVGAHGANPDGAVYVYRYGSKRWSFEQTLVPMDGNFDDWFGWDVALAQTADFAVIGAPQKGTNGGAYAATYDGKQWVLEAFPLPTNLLGPDANFGQSVTLLNNDTQLMIAAPKDHDAGFSGGSMFLYDRVDGQWVYNTKFDGSDTNGSDLFGELAAAEGDRALILAANAFPDKGYSFTGFAPIDCNLNNEPDGCDIFAGASLDKNGDGVPDECPAPILGDLDGDSIINGADLGILLLAWGKCPPPPPGAPSPPPSPGGRGSCAADFNGDGIVDGADLGILLLNWTG